MLLRELEYTGVDVCHPANIARFILKSVAEPTPKSFQDWIICFATDWIGQRRCFPLCRCREGREFGPFMGLYLSLLVF